MFASAITDLQSKKKKLDKRAQARTSAQAYVTNFGPCALTTKFTMNVSNMVPFILLRSREYNESVGPYARAGGTWSTTYHYYAL